MVSMQAIANQPADTARTSPLDNTNPRPNPRPTLSSSPETISVAAFLLAIWLLASFTAAQDAPDLDPPFGTPAVDGTTTPDPNATVPRSYRVPAEALGQIVEQLRDRFPPPLARVASDAQASRIVVMAPANVQQQIEQWLQQSSGATSGTRPFHSEATQSLQPSDQQVERRVNLPEPPQQIRVDVRNRKVADLLAQIQSIWGRRAAQVGNPGSQTALRLPGARGDRVDISADYVHQQIVLAGGASSLRAWSQVVSALDQPPSDVATTSVMAPQTAGTPVQRIVTALQQGLTGSDAVQIIRMGRTGAQIAAGSAQTFLQANDDASDGTTEPTEEPVDVPSAPDAASEDTGGGLIGPVQIFFLDGLDGVIVRGSPRDVDRVMKIIEEIERLSAETVPEIRILPLQHVSGERLYELIGGIYTEILEARQGSLSITALVKPNSLLLIGRPENIKVVVDLVQQLDTPVEPDTEFHVIQLRHMSAIDAQQTINGFYEERGGLGARVRIAADYRTNAIVIQGAPRDLLEIRRLLEKMDTSESGAVSEVRVFQLKNALANELVPVLQEAFRIDSRSQQGGGTSSPVRGFGGSGQADTSGASPTTGSTGTTATSGTGSSAGVIRAKSTILTLLQLDADGKQLLRSGILADARVSADPRANAIVVTAPSESMELITELIRQLDSLPGAEAQIKVFTISNGDASSLAEMLQDLFGQEANRNNQGGPAFQTAGTSDDGTLVPLRFTVDERTNTIIASGSMADLEVVEAILLRLDDDDRDQRESTVYRLRNSRARDVADAINEFLRSERSVQEIAPSSVSPFEQIEREVVVVAEDVSNSLIISATPRYFEIVMGLVKQLDERPPMVMVQVLIAEVTLTDLEEFGVELGLQDSFLFDRGVVANNIVTPGFNFNNQPLGNASSAAALASAGTIANQGLSNFGLGRTNSDLGYGGMVLSASSDSVSVLVRALEEEGRLNVLSRPQIMTLDNQPATIQVGQNVPYITNSSINQFGVTNSTQFLPVGILLNVQPRISPDGLVVMFVNAEKSDIAPNEGVPISISASGDVIRNPIFNKTVAQTVVSARSGQTVVLSGLITTSHLETHRGVPFLSDIPLLGRLFQFDSVSDERRELLFIMTPYIVRGDDDVEMLKNIETERMHWCMADVVALHGDLSSRQEMPNENGTRTIYPDRSNPLESVPTPGGEEAPSPESALPPGAEQMHEQGFDEKSTSHALPNRSVRQVSTQSEIVPVLPVRGKPSRAITLRPANHAPKHVRTARQAVRNASAQETTTLESLQSAEYTEPNTDSLTPADNRTNSNAPQRLPTITNLNSNSRQLPVAGMQPK
ncbi:MAG: hypothetical protein O3C60_19270 [Planctomycetota bacterium]|nr:hypothetical protein [Planctomycetota bacterium]